MSTLTLEEVREEIELIHREIARLTVDQLRGSPSAWGVQDILGAHPLPLEQTTLDFVRNSAQTAPDPLERERRERLAFGCMDLALEEQTGSLGDMLTFYMERGWMHVDADRIPALGVVPWLQAETDFDRREQMRKENTIFLKGIVNPMLLAMLELTVRAVTERFGFENYARFSEAKKQVSFAERASRYAAYLDATDEIYRERMSPWAAEVLGKPITGMSRYHALHLVRIRAFDRYFPVSRLVEVTAHTFAGLGFDLDHRSDVRIELSEGPPRNRDGLCVGVEIPGDVHIHMRPAGGLIDVETLLHETGHAFFLSHFDAQLPVELRRLYRSGAVDETFAFLFMNLIGNREWLTGPARMPAEEADRLAELYGTKCLCLIRRYIGKFLAERELHETKQIKNPEPYCRYLHAATGFLYEPEGYLVDMEPDFYSLDYLDAWAGAHVLGRHLEEHFGTAWFSRPEAGSFLKGIARQGRRDSLEEVLLAFCGTGAELPGFHGD